MNNIDEGPSVSVVIPTYNRAELLVRVLPTYLASSVVTEVIIVDDAGTDDTGGRIQQLTRSEPRLRYNRNDTNLGLPASRNRGARLSTGNWVLQAEDDLALGQGHVETLLHHAQLNGADIIAGRRIWMRLGESAEQALHRANQHQRPAFNEWLLDVNTQAVTPADVELPLLPANMLIRRSVFDQLMYTPAFKGQSSWREESDFQISALELGYKLVYCPHTVAFHYSRASQSFGHRRLLGTGAYAYRVFQNNLAFLRKHREYLAKHYPRSLFLGIPLLSAVVYGVYRSLWLLGVEVVRVWRTRKYGAFRWQ